MDFKRIIDKAVEVRNKYSKLERAKYGLGGQENKLLRGLLEMLEI